MATVTRVRRLVANPRRARKKNVHRRMTPKQIKFFGTKRQKAALKVRNRAKYSHRRTAARPRRRNIAGYLDEEGRFRPIRSGRLKSGELAYTPYKPTLAGETKRKRPAKKSKPRKRKQTRNPALIVTLGAVNPTKKRRKVVARKAKARRATTRRAKRNATRVVVTAPRRHNKRRYSRRRNPAARGHRRRCNPQLSFGGGVPMSGTLTAIGGGLVGVAAAKFIPTVLPAQMVSSNLMRTISTGVAAFISGWLAGKVSKPFGDAVLFGGLMQTGSTALNAFLPSVAGALGLSGLGAFADAAFALPENPIMRGLPEPAPPPAPRVTQSGIGRAFGNAF